MLCYGGLDALHRSICSPCLQLKLVRITHRVCEAYYARIYLSKAGEDYAPLISLDLRPSDAVNLAVRGQVRKGREEDVAGEGEGGHCRRMERTHHDSPRDS